MSAYSKEVQKYLASQGPGIHSIGGAMYEVAADEYRQVYAPGYPVSAWRKLRKENVVQEGSEPTNEAAAPSRPTINLVRQVLMNELGLTRESVRTEMEAIVEQVVQRHMGATLTAMERIVSSAVQQRLEALYRMGSWGKPGFQTLIENEVKAQVGALIRDRLAFSWIDTPLPLPGAKISDEKRREIVALYNTIMATEEGAKNG